MFERLLTVTYITSKNCFCSLSLNNCKQLQGSTLKVTYNGDLDAYFSIDVSARLPADNLIGINSMYGKLLGIKEHSVVTVTDFRKPPTIRSVTVVASSKEDHEVLELLAGTVQATLLHQIRVLNNHQKIVIWIGGSIHVTVDVREIRPVAPGRIDNLSEVVIKPPNSGPRGGKPPSGAPTAARDLVLRAVSQQDFEHELQQLRQPFNAFVSRRHLGDEIDGQLDCVIYKLSPISVNEGEKAAFVRVYPLEDVFQSTCLEKNVLVSETILSYFNLGMGSRFLLQRHEVCRNVTTIEVIGKKNYEKQFREFVNKNGEVVLSKNVPFCIGNQIKVAVNFEPLDANYCLVDANYLQACKVSFKLADIIIEPKNDELLFDVNLVSDIANYDEIINDCVFLFTKNAGNCSGVNNAIITGKLGCGKSSILQLISNKLRNKPNFIYTRLVECKAIKGKTLESLHKLFTGICSDLVNRQPSVLILDDLHILCENVHEGDGLAQNAIYFNRVSEMLANLLRMYTENNEIGVLATATSVLTLNKQIYATRGNHLLRNVFTICDLLKVDRKKVLNVLFGSCSIEMSLVEMAEKTECFAMQDLVEFVEKARFESYQADSNQVNLTITKANCEIALKSTNVTSLEGVQLQATNGKTLDDIGGLKSIKKELVEIMLWPSKYPSLFENAPLRLPSGLLLYGPPGTGKTVLAAAAAKHCGLRLISIKGPELLSKYIGASEQAVRDVFQRAQSAKPCVLFFDEFDSLAPRRGHDTTGVTDRVVNQLLTQLDGVESLSGVFVLAATSRPDLLDPALLRPGRLDRHLCCTLPDKEDRLDILRALAQHLKLPSNVDLGAIAEGSDGFSGADLQALLYTAQLESVRNLITDEANEIDQARLIDALNRTRPSLSRSELAKYRKIYEGFEGGSSGDLVPGSRATLA